MSAPFLASLLLGCGFVATLADWIGYRRRLRNLRRK